jgi:hypothetical protein
LAMTNLFNNTSIRWLWVVVVKPNDIISAWLAGLTIWALAMLGLVLVEQPEIPVIQTPPSHGIMVDDWYARGFPDDMMDAEAIWEPDDWDDPSNRRRSTFLPPLPSPGSQQGSNYQQNDQPSRQQ